MRSARRSDLLGSGARAGVAELQGRNTRTRGRANFFYIVYATESSAVMLREVLLSASSGRQTGSSAAGST